jgi:pimeloyl-ACP methyl ester carboxylesterase
MALESLNDPSATLVFLLQRRFQRDTIVEGRFRLNGELENSLWRETREHHNRCRLAERGNKEHGFAEKAVLEGMSRGGLIVYNWASANPDKVAVIYGDAPVMDFKSWPGAGHAGILKSYGFKNEDEAKNYTGNPIDNLRPLAKAGIPIIHVVGDVDEVVPVSENTAIAKQRYDALGGVFEVIHKKDVGHKHGLKAPQPLVDFVIGHTKSRSK